MSHATADLEYFMCDMCHTYVHKDIFCPHRRECKGKDSQELRKAEVEAIAASLDAAERQRSIDMAAGPRCGVIPLNSKFACANTIGGVAVTSRQMHTAPALQALKVRRELELMPNEPTAEKRVAASEAVAMALGCPTAAFASLPAPPPYKKHAESDSDDEHGDERKDVKDFAPADDPELRRLRELSMKSGVDSVMRASRPAPASAPRAAMTDEELLDFLNN